MDHNENVIKILAKELSYNYFTSSFDLPSRYSFEKKVKTIFDPEKGFDSFHGWGRNILVIGAGATFDSYQQFPLAGDAIKLLEESFGLYENVNSNFTKKYKEEKEKIQELLLNYHGSNKTQNPLDFETTLSILSTLLPVNEIRKKLKEIYNFRYLPSLSCEIIAHLFKHGFVDAIVNFNFDEILDQAIEEEMGASKYFNIVSEGQYEGISELLVSGRMRVPVYIKPHGTASHPSSMRFTKDHYFNLPIEMKNLLKELFTGAMGNNSSQLKRVNVVTVGYGMKSLEFNQVLRELPPKSKIFHINYDERPESEITDIDDLCHIDGKDKKLPGSYYFIDTKMEDWENNKEHRDGVLNYQTSLSTVLKKLWKEIEACFQGTYKPRKINRHEIIALLFYSRQRFHKSCFKWCEKDEKHLNELITNKSFINHEQLKTHFDPLKYFKDRVLIEIVISIIKNNGVIQIEESNAERLGKYYHEYRKAEYRQQSFDGSFNQILSLSEFFTAVGLKELKNFEKPVYHFTPEKKGGNLSMLEVINQVLKKLEKSKLTSNLLKSKLNSPKHKEKFIELLRNIAEGNLYDIVPRYSDPGLFLFNNFRRRNIIKNNLGLTYHFQELLALNKTWDILLIISEKGNLLNKVPESVVKKWKDFGKKIILITSKEAFQLGFNNDLELFKTLTERYKGVLYSKNKQREKTIYPKSCYYLPFWLHNYHMTLFLKKDCPNEEASIICPGNSEDEYCFRVVKSIFYKKYGFNNKITPVYFRGTAENQKDQIKLLKEFYYYFELSKKYSKSGFRELKIEELVMKVEDEGFVKFLKRLAKIK